MGDILNIQTIEELDPLERLSLVNMSYSRLNTYDMCPAMYFYTYILKADRVFGPPAVLGNVLHSVLEDHVGEELSHTEMLKTMDQYREEYDPDKLIDDDLMTAGRYMLSEFIDRHQGETFNIIGKEAEFNFVIGSVLMRGYIDLLMRRSDGVLTIVDYKSGSYEVTYKDIPENLQVGIYALAAREMFPEEEQIYAELYYLRSGRRKGHLFTLDELEVVYDRVLDCLNTIINDRAFKYTDNRRICSFCDHAKTGVCPVGRARNRR